jgi:NitT/TauT family transport system permease protein
VAVGVTTTGVVGARPSPGDDGPGAASAAPGTRRWRGPGLTDLAVWALSVGVFLAGWYCLRQLLEPSERFILPPPHAVWTQGFADGATLRDTLDATWVTAREAIAGLALAGVIGVLVGAAMSQAAWVERSLYPWAIVLQTVPILAIVPLVDLWAKNDILWMQEGFRERIIVVVLISVFPIITNTLFGLLAADEGHHDLFSLHGSSRWRRFRTLELPGAVPAIVTGFRIAAGLAVAGAIVGEYFFRVGEQGIGQQLDVYLKGRDLERWPKLYSVITCACLLGVLVFALFGWLGRRAAHWHVSAHEE